LSAEDDLKNIRKLAKSNFHIMLRLVELGLGKWWTASSLLAIAHDNLAEEQKDEIRRSYEEKFGKMPDINSFLELGKGKNRFEELFFSHTKII
jgi:hypothetical protein